MQIAIDASEREVLDTVSPAMDLRDNVLNVQRRERRVILVQVTILAKVVSALSNLSSNLGGDHRAANW